MKHLIAIEELSKENLLSLLDTSEGMVEVSSRELKKVPALRGRTVVNMFFEASTRTRTSFEIAAKRLSADVINLSVATSSVSKGETLYDTARTLEAMNPDVIVIRHASSGAPDFLRRSLKTSIVNAGDGMHEHPTQALLDCLTLRQHFSSRPKGIEGLTVAIVGDVLHSRVARSNIWAHLLLGNSVRLVGPAPLLPREFVDTAYVEKSRLLGSALGSVSLYHDLREGLKGADVVMCLRVQTERLQQFFIPSLEEYSRTFGVSERVLQQCAPQAVVLHPGPVNRGIEVSSEVMEGPRSLVRHQVSNGVAVRMGVLFAVATAMDDSQSSAAGAAESQGGSELASHLSRSAGVQA